MKKIITLSLLAFLFSFISGDLVSTKISSHVVMDISKDLNLIPMNEIELKYAKQNAPMAVYETADQEVKLVARLLQEASDSSTKPMFKNPEANKAVEKDLFLEKLFKKSALASQFDAINFLQDTIKEINGNKFMIFEYTAEASGVDSKGLETKSESYAYYQMCFIKNKTYIFNFYCPKDRQGLWQSRANAMMNSVKIRK